MELERAPIALEKRRLVSISWPGNPDDKAEAARGMSCEEAIFDSPEAITVGRSVAQALLRAGDLDAPRPRKGTEKHFP